MGLRTIQLKLYNPSTLKKKVIETALINYNNAFNYLLKKAAANIDQIESEYKSPKGTYSNLALSKWIDKDLSADINQFDIQPFKDSIKLDFGMVLASYFVQKNSNSTIQFPSFKINGVTIKDKLRPIYFCRYDTKRSFCLLYDADNGKFFVKLFLMNTKNAKLRSNLKASRKLTYIYKKQEELKLSKKETFILVPLSFGRWQENILKQALNKPEILRTAHLIKKENNYFLSLSIDLPEEDKVEAGTFLGVSRGIEKALNYTIVDKVGNLLENGILECPDGLNLADIKSNINILANKIVEIAYKNKSMVILQNLIGKGDKLSWSMEGVNFKPIFGCRLYNDVVRILEYKLTQKGLPVPAKVSSVDIFHRCNICGCNTKKNRFSKTMFICTTCGVSSNLDSLGSLNLATKLLKYQNTNLKLKKLKTHDGMYIQNDLIGIDLFIHQNENPFEKLKEEIKEIALKLEEGSSINIIIEKLIKQDYRNIEII